MDNNLYGVSPQVYGAIFGLNAFGLVACGQINAVLVGRAGMWRLLGLGVIVSATSGLLVFGIIGGAFLPQAAAHIAAIPPFMSLAPRPYRRPSRVPPSSQYCTWARPW